jgi:DNA-binding transcriptional MocR family regulator
MSTQPTSADILEELRALRSEVESLREQVQEQTTGRAAPLPRLQDFAEELGISRSTMYAKLDRRGIPVRDSHGYPKDDGDRSAAHVTRTEWDERERLDTRTVRQQAGLYD